MQFASYDRYGRADVVVVRSAPTPAPRSGELLVRVCAAALNPKDILVQSGRFPLYRLLAGSRFPKRLGYDWSGEVLACGPGVSGFSIGDAVYGMIQGWAAGACATHALVSVRELASKPATLSWEEAAAVPLAAQTALQGLRDVGRVERADRVLINGASGGVGTFAVQIAKALGAHVTAVTSGRNRDFVKTLGADEIVDYEITPLETLTNRFDVFFDVFGNRSFGFAKPLLVEHGTFVSTVPTPHLLRDVAATLFGKQRARFVNVRSRPRDLVTLAEWADRGLVRPILDSTFPLAEIQAAEIRQGSRRARGKVVLTMPPDPAD